MGGNLDMSAQIGVIGGSGLYDMTDLRDRQEHVIETPFGAPSGPYVTGILNERRVAFLARHGPKHRLLPSEINFRANIYGFKVLGVEWIASASAVGSLQDRYRPTDVVVPDQFLDRTVGRTSTFFGKGLAAHVSLANPFCNLLADLVCQSAKIVGATVHRGGTYVCMEGPQFSTFSESTLYRSWGMDIIGMTNVQEAKLAREAEICYATLALVTDYDCWHEEHANVTVDILLANLMKNATMAQRIISDVVAHLPMPRTCECATALSSALITRPEAIPKQTRKDLAPIIGKYIKN